MKRNHTEQLTRMLVLGGTLVSLGACGQKLPITVREDRERVVSFVRGGQKATAGSAKDQAAARQVAMRFFDTGIAAIAQSYPRSRPEDLRAELEIGQVSCAEMGCDWDQRFSNADQLAIVDAAIFGDPSIRSDFPGALYRSGLFNKYAENEAQQYVTWVLFKQDVGGVK